MDSTLATTVSEMAIELLIACAPFLALAPLLLFSVVLVALVGVSVFNKVVFVLRLLVQLVRVIIGVISFLVSVVGFTLRFINEMKAVPESEDSDHTRSAASGESSYEYTDWDDQEEEEEPEAARKEEKPGVFHELPLPAVISPPAASPSWAVELVLSSGVTIRVRG